MTARRDTDDTGTRDARNLDDLAKSLLVERFTKHKRGYTPPTPDAEAVRHLEELREALGLPPVVVNLRERRGA